MVKALKLRYVLPVTQMALAYALLLWSQVWERILTQRVHGMVGPLPPFNLLVLLNLPAAILRGFWFRYLPSPWDDFLLIPVIGLLWYWVALNIESWRKAKGVLRFKSIHAQIAADALPIVGGLAIAFVCIFNMRRSMYSPVFFILFETFGFLWCAFLIFFFSRDMTRLKNR
jgi:hypothetical protein